MVSCVVVMNVRSSVLMGYPNILMIIYVQLESDESCGENNKRSQPGDLSPVGKGHVKGLILCGSLDGVSCSTP